MDEMPRVSIIILNWNGWEDTIECLESVYQITYPNYDVIVVDNGSQNDSLNKIKDYCLGNIFIKSDYIEYQRDNKPIQVVEYWAKDVDSIAIIDGLFQSLPSNRRLILLKNNENKGFTEGNNIAISFALNFLNPEYVLLLNNDTVVDKCFLTELIEVGEGEQDIGFVGPKIYFYNYNGDKKTIQFAGAEQNTWIFRPKHIGWKETDVGQYDENYEVDYIHGSCILVKVTMIRQIGLLDNSFFSYREENDWGIRGLKKGWKSVYAYRSKVWHKGGGSTNNKVGRYVSTYYLVRNNFLFMKKHATKYQKIVYLCYFFVIEFWFKFGVFLIYQKDLNTTQAFLKGTKDGLKQFFASSLHANL